MEHCGEISIYPIVLNVVRRRSMKKSKINEPEVALANARNNLLRSIRRVKLCDADEETAY